MKAAALVLGTLLLATSAAADPCDTQWCSSEPTAQPLTLGQNAMARAYRYHRRVRHPRTAPQAQDAQAKATPTADPAPEPLPMQFAPLRGFPVASTSTPAIIPADDPMPVRPVRTETYRRAAVAPAPAPAQGSFATVGVAVAFIVTLFSVMLASIRHSRHEQPTPRRAPIRLQPQPGFIERLKNVIAKLRRHANFRANLARSRLRRLGHSNLLGRRNERIHHIVVAPLKENSRRSERHETPVQQVSARVVGISPLGGFAISIRATRPRGH